MDKTIADILTRRSVRSFSARPVEKNDIETLIRAGLSAPSAHGKSPWQIAVLQDRPIRDAIVSVLPWHKSIADAPVAFLILGKPDACVQKEYWPVDCAALTENVLIAARSLGLGTVWCGITPIESNLQGVLSVLDIPEGYIPFGTIAIGYPASEQAFREKETPGDDARVVWNPQWVKK